MPQIILKESTAHLVSCTCFTRDVDQYKNASFSQLYQPPRTLFSQITYHQLLSSCEYCKVFKNSFFIEHHQKQSFADALQNGVLKNFENSKGKHLCQSLFLKNLQAEGLQLYLKNTPTQVFSCEVCEIFRNTFFYRTPRVIASTSPVAASVFF